MAATGEPILCAIVLACKTMKMDYIMGVNPFADVDNNNLLTMMTTVIGKTSGFQWVPHAM